MNTLTLPVNAIEKVEKKLRSVLEEVRALKRKQTKKTRAEEPSEYLKQAIRQAEEDLKAGRASPTFDNAEDAIAFLDKQGI